MDSPTVELKTDRSAISISSFRRGQRPGWSDVPVAASRWTKRANQGKIAAIARLVCCEQLDRKVEPIHPPAYAEINEGLWLGQDEAGLVWVGECPPGLAPAIRAARLARPEFRVK